MSNNFITLDNLKVEGKKVLIRVDLNVPMQDGKITNLERIIRSSPTIKELSEKQAKVIVLSHLGRPKGTGFEQKFTLKPIAEAIATSLEKPVKFIEDCIGGKPKQAIDAMQNGDIIMLENVRFHKEESENSPEFTKQLAALGEIYVNDAFSAAHRSHSSTEGLAHLLPSVAGRLMQAELEALEAALGNPDKPVVALVGGAKISTKLAVLYNLIKKVDYLIIGGGMGNTFLNALGVGIGKSLCEHEMKEECLKIIAEAKQTGCEIVLPVDSRSATELKSNTPIKIVATGALDPNFEIFDAGPLSIENFQKVLELSKTLLWNGPLGVFEVKPFDTATNEVALFAARLTKTGKLKSIAGGGDTVSALQQAGVYNDFTYISTAGGAFLEWLEGKPLPGVAVLIKK